MLDQSGVVAMYCQKCKIQLFGGSICHFCGGTLSEGEEAVELAPLKRPLKIVTKKRHSVSKEFGQTIPGHIARLLVEVAIFCGAFVLLSLAVVHIANWLAEEMALPGQKAKYVDIRGRWMKYFWYIGCGAIVFLTVKLRFKPGK